MSLLETPNFALADAFAQPACAPAALEKKHIWNGTALIASPAALLLFAAAACAAWTMSGAVVPWDSKNQFYPFFRFLSDSLQRGDFPLWNPYHFGGHPAVADPQSLIFTPSMVLLALLVPQASMQVFDGFILAHLLFGGFGVLGLFQRRGWHPAAAVLAAAIFMLGGSASARLQHTGMIISYAYFPFALWALEAALERRSYAAGIAFGVLAALMALGRDQVAYLFCATLMFAVFWHMFRAAAPLAWLRQRWLLLATMGVVGALVMLVPVLLTLQFLGASNRPGISFGVALTGSLTPVNFMTMLVPNFFGSLDWNYDYWGPGYETTLEPNWTDRCINYLFIGTAPMLLLIWHGFAGGRLFSRAGRLFAILAIAATLYAVGRSTPLFALIFDHVHGVSLYRRPADATFLLNFALACGAGYLLHRYIADGLPRVARGIPALAATLAVALAMAALVASGVALSMSGGHLAASLAASGVAVVVAACFVLALALPRTYGQRGLAALLVVTASMGELVWRNAASSLNSEPLAYYSVYQTMTATEAAGLAALRKDMNGRIDQGEWPRVEILGLGGPWQNASMVLGLENTLGYNPLRISDYERAVGPGENAGDPNLRHFPGTFRGYKCKLASLLGLEYLVLDRPLAKLPRHFPRPLATTVFAGDRMYVYRLGKPAPRAYLATQVRSVDSDSVLEEHSLPEFDRSHEALIDAASMSALGADVARGDANPALDPHVEIAAHHNDTVVIEVDSDRPGVLVLHDLYYPGWEARVDGVQGTLLRANLLFRGVEVPAGHHIVEFSYHPLSLANLSVAARGLLGRNDE